MHLIAYVSSFNAKKYDPDEVLEEIVNVAKVENAKRQITGVLFYLNGVFLQIIEGEEALLRQLMSNIEKDKRHSNIEYLIDTKVEQRGFQKWNMDSFHLDSKQKISRDTIKDLTEGFKINLLPRSDMLAYYYKALLKQKTY